MSTDRRSTKPRVVIAGGGIAGMEAALALADLAGDRARLSLVAPDPDFIYKPLTVEEPFTQQPAERHELEPALHELGVEFIADAVSAIDPGSHTLTLNGGLELPYDLLVVCIGGRARPAYEGVETLAGLWGSRGDLPIDELIRQAGKSPSGTLALLVPPTTSWPLPLYELALLIRRRSEELGSDQVRLRVVTAEPAPLNVFGSTASGAVAELLAARHISVETDRHVIQDPSGVLRLPPEDAPLKAEVVIALPEIEGPAIPGLPADAHGFIPTDLYGRVQGVDDVYAAGDGTSFPVKQGGLATQQADAAAEHIAARLGAEIEPQPFDPVLRGQLLTGADSLHMKHGLAGGQGEGSASADYLWWPPHKVGGRYLSAWLGHTAPTDLEPPSRPLEVEVAWPHDWHGEPLSYDAERPREN
jgi:sulfide:quinone oxidoreductase